MRIGSTLSLAVCLALFTACGGGGISGTGVGYGGPSARVVGQVTALDGSSLGLGGIVVESTGDGGSVVTSPDGSFQIDVPAGEPVILRFEDPQRPDDAEGEPKDAPEKDDTTPDGSDISGDEVEIEPLDKDEECEVEVELEDGEVVECRVDRPEREDEAGEPQPRFEAECRLKPTENSSEPEAIGEAELECEDDCCVLEVEVGDVLTAATLTVALQCEGQIEELGAIAIVEGGGHFELDSCTLDVLPFGVESIADLTGCTLLLLDENGDPALAGNVPGKRDEEDDDEKDEDGEGDDEEGDEKDEDGEGGDEEGDEKDEDGEGGDEEGDEKDEDGEGGGEEGGEKNEDGERK